MTFFGILAILCAASVPAIAYFMLTYVWPGRATYAMVRLALGACIVGEVIAGGVVFGLAAKRDDPLIDGVATLVYVVSLLWCLPTSWNSGQFHFQFTATFRERDVLVPCTVQQVVELVWWYAWLYEQVVVSKTSLPGKVHLKAHGKIVANISLSDGRAHDLFGAFGVRFLGKYDWPRNGIGVAHVTVAYKGNDMWSLDDGSGPAELKFADPPGV